MFTKIATLITHRFNGSADFIEVDGNKFVPDPTDPSKAKIGEDGKPVPYVEQKAPEIKDLSTAELEDLAKVNPKLAKFLSDKAETDKKLKDAADAEEKRKREDAEKRGEWQKIADDEKAKREAAEKRLAEQDEQLGKYRGSVESVVKEMMAQIPEANRSLVPADFSPRQKLEYITANAKVLGVKVVGGTGKIDPSDKTPDGTDEGKMVARIEELMKKGKARTATENNELQELGSKLTAMRRAAQQK